MKGKMHLLSALLCALLSSAFAQEFPIGIYFGGNQNAIDSVHAMGFTWLQAYGGWTRADSSTYSYILKNNKNLKVAALLERNIYNSSFAQRMEYQAEQAVDGSGVRNYFASNPTGGLGSGFWQALVSSHAAGFMVQSPLPNDQYFYERMHWVATARISIDLMGVSTDEVVRIEVFNGSTPLAQRIVRRSEFSSTAFRTFEAFSKEKNL